MSELSPATQAVLNAYCESPWDPNLQHGDRFALAAALRAAADQVVPNEKPTGKMREWQEERLEQRRMTRQWLLAIADELEAQ